MFCKKDVSKISHESTSAGVQAVGTDVFLLILGNFQEHLFVKHLWTNICVKQGNEKIFSHKYIQKKTDDGVLWSAVVGMMSLEFYLKGTQSQVFPCNICEVLQSFSFTEHYLLLGNCFWFPATFLTYCFLYQQYINSVTTSCLGFPGIQAFHIISSQNF